MASLVKILDNAKFLSKTVLGESAPSGYSISDASAAAYITAVETADGASLEDSVKQAIDQFVIGCKSDGIWSALKASCILAGARTLNGALVPLVGVAPTNNNFISADYNRKTGLIGNGLTKYLNTNRANNADPQNNQHMSVFSTSVGTEKAGNLIGGGGGNTGATNIGKRAGTRSQSSVGNTPPETGYPTGFIGLSRASSASYAREAFGNLVQVSIVSQTPSNANIAVFAGIPFQPQFAVNSRITFYSVGEAIDLLKLKSRVTNFLVAINTAI